MKKVFFMVWFSVYLIINLSLSWAHDPDAASTGQTPTQSEKRVSKDRGGLTVEEIIQLKKAGISESTIQLLIEDRQLPQKMKEKAFAQEHIGTWNIKDSQGKEAIIYSTGKGRREECDYEETEYWRALELLRAMRPRPIIRLDQGSSIDR
jgi:predicted DNA-binding transcriptional regulator AlpA